MKRTLFQILAVAAVGAMCSCSDFLDPYPSAIRSEEYILTNPTTMQGLIGKCYDYMAQNYNDNEGAYLDCATDNAVRTSTTDVLRRFAVGVTSPTNDPFETYWDRDYKGIYNVNMFLKDDRGLNMRYMLDEHLDELLRNRLWGEAYALRAWFQWDLLQKFGGRGTDGRLLGYPILLEPVRVWEMSPEEMRGLRFERNTYDECVAQILRDCDSAYKYLPIAHRDFLVPNADDRRVLGAQNWGRLDGISAVAIKALVYLTWASPRFNPDGDVERWSPEASPSDGRSIGATPTTPKSSTPRATNPRTTTWNAPSIRAAFRATARWVPRRSWSMLSAWPTAIRSASRPSTPTIPRIPTSTGTRAFTA